MYSSVIKQSIKMKFLISIILISIYISLSESACSSDNWKAVENLDASKILGRWYATKRLANGQHGKTHCLWHDLYKHPTKPNTVVETSNRMFRNGKNKSKMNTQGDLTFVDPKKTEGVIGVAMKNGAVVIKYVVDIDYDKYALLRSCHDGVEYFWLYLRSLIPSNDTMATVNKIMDKQQIDQSKVVDS